MEELNQHEIVELTLYNELKSDLCGTIIKNDGEEVIVQFETNKQMISDKSNLIHPGFIFNAASYAAMCLVNQQNSLIIKSNVQFLAPLEFGQDVIFTATIQHASSKQYEVFVKGTLLEIKIFEGTFYISILDKEIFKLNLDKSNP